MQDTPPALVAPGPDVQALLAAPREAVVTANGVRFSCLVWGPPQTSAPLVLALHGFPDAASTWQDLGPVLARAGYRVVAPHTRGYWPSGPAPDGDYSTRALATDALALMDAFGARRAAIVGHDWGAATAYAAVAAAPERITKLVAVAIPHPQAIRPDLLNRSSHFLTYPLPGAAGRFAADDVAGLDRIVAKWSPEWAMPAADRAAAKRAFRHDPEAPFGYYRSFVSQITARKAVGAIATPTLLVYGEADGALDPADFARSAPYFTGPVTLLGLPHVGHFPQRESPAVFAEAVRAFLGPVPVDAR